MNMTEKTKKKMISAAYLGPSVIGVMVFFVIPFCVIIYYSLVDNPINREFVFLQNFINILNNQAFLKAAKNTATFSLITVPLAVILSLGLALLLDEKIPYKSQFRTFFLSPMMGAVASVVRI
ncbi:MAG: sugar ABC transporter permease, partial [Acetivibrio ethanolgignens]